MIKAFNMQVPYCNIHWKVKCRIGFLFHFGTQKVLGSGTFQISELWVRGAETVPELPHSSREEQKGQRPDGEIASKCSTQNN